MNRIYQRLRQRAALIDTGIAVAAGSLFPLGFAPLSFWPLSLIAIATLWCLLQRPTGQRHPFLIGWLFGLGTYGVGASWVFVSIYYFGNVPLLNASLATMAFVIVLALSTGLSTWGYQRLRPSWSHASSTLAWSAVVVHAGQFTACWVAVEWGRTWFLTGFPWLFMGYAGLDTAYAGFAPLFGVFGVSALMVFSASLIASAYWHQRQHAFAVFTVAAIWMAGLGLTFVNWTQANSDTNLTVYLLQGNIPQVQKRDPTYFDEHLKIYTDMTNALWSATPEHAAQAHMVIWPEAAIPKLLHSAWDTYIDMDTKARAANAAWISGVPWAEYKSNETIFQNGVLAAGIGSGFYVKQKLVPFGESLPFPSITHKLGPLFNLSRYGFTPGEADQRPLTAQGMQIAPFICYEIVFPSLVRRQAAEADLLLTISNDGWFGQSFGPDQHFQMARMRALETGKMLLRVTNNGITAIIDEQGHVISRLKTFTRATLSGVAYSTTGQTPFMLLGSWPTLIVILGILIAGIMTRVLHHYFKTNQVPTTDQNWHTLSPHSEPSTLTQEPPYVCDATHPR